MDTNSTASLPYAYGDPACQGVIRTQPEDFQVDEILGFEPDGEGEHLLLHVEKWDSNTDWVAGRLAQMAGVPRSEVSYAGLKDRRAVTRQWFSVRLAGKTPPAWQVPEDGAFRVLDQARHGRKLRIGALRGNRFSIRVRELEGDTGRLGEVLHRLALEGIPNFFGEQRFGTQDGNIESARQLFNGELKRVKRQKRGFYLSAVRSMLFNKVLGVRVKEGSWNQPLAGERMMLDGSRSSFSAPQLDAALLERHRTMDIHCSGPLWGRGEPMATGEAARLEQSVLQDEGFWCEGLERFGLKMERRALRVAVNELKWSIQDKQLLLEFALPKGCFATALLRECLDYRSESTLRLLRDSNT